MLYFYVFVQYRGEQRVYMNVLPVLGGTGQGVMMAWADLFYAVHPDSLEGFRCVGTRDIWKTLVVRKCQSVNQ